MTFAEIEHSTKDFLVPSEVAEVIGCKPFSLNVQAKEDIGKLGFPAALVGTRLLIPRLAFVRWVKYGNAPLSKEEQAT